ncbi:MAG: histidinol dehydrogenase [Deltaproteobacteria bacterium]|nr:MAG: histidinol dehydrogenase [Deltaproteobacteria bacterium]
MKIYTYPSEAAEKRVADIIDRGLGFSDEQLTTVTGILDDVKKRGDAALIDYTRQFDAPNLTADNLEVTEADFHAAEKTVDVHFIAALEQAVAQIEAFHKKQRTPSWITLDRPGVFLGQLIQPVEAAGVYAPGATGGKTPLVSSVLMGAIPAKIAGVDHVSLMTPPTKEGTIDPHLLVAAKRTGIDTVYKAGSAWAIAALAYGTERVKKVDVIVGPGNIYVTLAKKIVSGTVGIDMIAGPSEILAIADASANPEHVAADLLSQAEHDVMASAILVTPSADLAEQVKAAVYRQIEHLNRKAIAQPSIEDFGAILVVPDLDTAFTLSNRLAPEHLELLIEDPLAHVGKVRNAGAVFMGHYTPEPVGDYIAGPNHVLPTAGTARFSSALSVDHFTKKTSLIHYSKDALAAESDAIIRLAEIEGLNAHANSVRIRRDA